MKHPEYKRTLPGCETPDLILDSTNGKAIDLDELRGRNFTMVVFYRGMHCPKCRENLKDLNRKIEDFEKRGVACVAVSMDGKNRADQSKEEWKLDKLDLAYDLSEAMASQWGLFLSDGLESSSVEPRLFSEPAVFLIRPDRTLYAAWVQSSPFGRPSYDEILDAVDYALKENYPARGSHAVPKTEKAEAA